jgi:hypothetical protein
MCTISAFGVLAMVASRHIGGEKVVALMIVDEVESGLGCAMLICSSGVGDLHAISAARAKVKASINNHHAHTSLASTYHNHNYSVIARKHVLRLRREGYCNPAEGES